MLSEKSKIGTGKVKLAVVGGGFGADFYFHLHPNCEVIAVSSQSPAELSRLQQIYESTHAYSDLADLLLNKNIDAVALFTPVPDHAAHICACLNHDKHVLCAVPVGLNIEECQQVKNAVKKAGKIFMMAETSYYRQDTISARHFYESGRFGKLLKVDAHYHHPGLEEYFFDADKQPTWRHGLPPMLYSTHCTAFLLGIDKNPISSVSCIGWNVNNEVLIGNRYNNTFWNQTALFQNNQGVALNVDINWRGALKPTERCDWYGEMMSFLGPNVITSKSYLVSSTVEKGNDDGGFINYEPKVEEYQQPLWWMTDKLPSELRFQSGHYGSHTFITHEFIDSIMKGRSPSIDVELAINMTLPGIIANESSKKNGEQMKVPNFSDL